ncbi:hypothetical protein TNCV_777311 [Trichonephila clavipes]|nr:hypothetical protein TNCV_777311 [Trichonephila clavipes]
MGPSLHTRDKSTIKTIKGKNRLQRRRRPLHLRARGRHLNSDDANLHWDLILPKAPKPNRCSKDLFHAVLSYDMATVDFLHHENPPTWAGVEPATLGAEGQRQTNHTTQLELIALFDRRKQAKTAAFD